MGNFFINNLNNVVFSGVLILLSLICLFLIKKHKFSQNPDKIDDLYLKLKEEIKFAVAPKFVDISVGLNELVDLAVEIWRMDQRIVKSAQSLPENQLRGLENSVQKLKRYLEKYDVQIVDYKNQKYNEGLNLDILSVEKDSSVQQPMVKETVEPTIMCKGQVVRKAKIILLTNK